MYLRTSCGGIFREIHCCVNCYQEAISITWGNLEILIHIGHWVVFPRQFPRLPHDFGEKLKSQRLDISWRFLAFGYNGKPGKHCIAFTLFNCQHLMSCLKHFKAHTTATSLGQPEPLFCKSFASLETFLRQWKQLTLALSNTLSTCLNIFTWMFAMHS